MTGTKVKVVTPGWNWDRLANGTQPWRAAWEDLDKWVRWYTATYELWQSMPVCWYRHSRLIEELRALRFLHAAVFDPRPATADQQRPAGGSGPSARAYSEWMITRREWERVVLGLDPREHGGCAGLSHAPAAPLTARGRNDRLTSMAAGLLHMLDTTAPSLGPQG